MEPSPNTNPVYNTFLRQLLQAQAGGTGGGRPIEQLLQTNDPLKGEESQRLRTYFSSRCMEPSRDLDAYGRALFFGDITKVKDDFRQRVSKHSKSPGTDETADPEEVARKTAAQEVFELTWGPTKVPVFDVLLLASMIKPQSRSKHLEITHWLLDEAKIPVDGKDLSGSTALYHTISTKPGLDLEFAQVLYDAGADINIRNRYGGTAAHEIAMVWEAYIPEKARRAADALEWFLAHGGNIDIKDHDGATARTSVELARTSSRTPVSNGMRVVIAVVEKEDKRRRRLGGKCCTFCGREPAGDVKLLGCSRCRVAKYCAPPGECQKRDWQHHKGICKPSTAPK